MSTLYQAHRHTQCLITNMGTVFILAQCQLQYINTHINREFMLRLSGWCMAIDHPDPTSITMTHIKNHLQICSETSLFLPQPHSLPAQSEFEPDAWLRGLAYYQDCVFVTFKECLSVPAVLYSTLWEQMPLGDGANSLHSTDKLTLQLLIWGDFLMMNSALCVYACSVIG